MTDNPMNNANPLELYIHIPFCVKKCAYCDFVSFACCEHQFDAYIEALCREIRILAPLYKGRDIVSIYIGGGTPTILSAEQITKLVETLNREFEITGTKEKRTGLFRQKIRRPEVEFSIECNPGTADKKKLEALRRLGINRLSIGLQSADPQDLIMLGRIHTYEDFQNTFEWAREAGFDNISTDLMQAIPGQDLRKWQRVLAMLAVWKPEHISAYSLIVEEGTLFYQMQQEGRLSLPDEESEREIYHYTKAFLEKAGYRRYEISNYAVPGMECRHNCGYWRRTPYLGLGLHASSLIDEKRWKNTDNLMQYLQALGADAQDEEILTQIREETESLSVREQMEETMILGLRMSEGVSKEEFLQRYGMDPEYVYGDVIRRMQDLKLLTNDRERIYLTEQGIDVSNVVLAEFLISE